ncbi:hypothetical protein HU200_015643 [Digitaria exilis]|uniref:RING-type domain-containing protein n=1 Tax=Digitaria exilis TaxID=1010633 RepID=A0A835KJZ6_9POAL|nr:hypothetical protein HU200_015643 [Digitaria exilis]
MNQCAQEIAHLHVAIQNTNEALQTAKQDVHFFTEFAKRTHEINKILVSQLQGTNEHGRGLTNALEPAEGTNQAMNIEETAVENVRPTIFCRTCCSREACMLILPCQHVCACKPCGDNLTVCPMCGTAIAEAIEGRFV